MLGPDGVSELYPTIDGGTTFYMDMSLDDPTKDPCFSYDHINMEPKQGLPAKAERKTEKGVTFYVTEAPFCSYNSGTPPGKSLRLGIYASKGSKGQKQKHTWREKPDFLYDTKGIRNHELTGFIRMDGDLNAGITDEKKMIHKSLAMKVCGAKEDNGRSLIETCYPINSKDNVRANYDYDHFPYLAVDNKDAGGAVRQFFSGDYCEENKWVGLKHVHIVSDDKKQSTNKLYVDINPFDSNGKPRNEWKLKAIWIDKGTLKTKENKETGKIEGYGGIPCTWRSQVDKFRIDGWKYVSFTLLSIREIDPHAQPSIQENITKSINPL
ncbi:MAG TPA: hypothetical protein VN703_02540 [Candidatus Sulfopaludibacter sp.]|jgi:hypothetical protein|nr:hypothetical protein [Candidatus Sulfopaludibacter sp.]